MLVVESKPRLYNSTGGPEPFLLIVSLKCNNGRNLFPTFERCCQKGVVSFSSPPFISHLVQMAESWAPVSSGCVEVCGRTTQPVSVTLQMADCVSKVELTVSCSNLLDKDVGSKSDPLCVLLQSSGADKWMEVRPPSPAN